MGSQNLLCHGHRLRFGSLTPKGQQCRRLGTSQGSYIATVARALFGVHWEGEGLAPAPEGDW